MDFPLYLENSPDMTICDLYGVVGDGYAGKIFIGAWPRPPLLGGQNAQKPKNFQKNLLEPLRLTGFGR